MRGKSNKDKPFLNKHDAEESVSAGSPEKAKVFRFSRETSDNNCITKAE